MELTKNLQLKKPAENDFYNVADFNENAEILDTEVQALKDGKLDKTGGEVTGGINTSSYIKFKSGTTDFGQIRTSGSNGDRSLTLFGTSDNFNGCNLYLSTSEVSNPQFKLKAGDGTSSQDLTGKPDGTLTWCGKNIVRSVGGMTADANGNIASPFFCKATDPITSTANDTVTKWVSLGGGVYIFDKTGCVLNQPHQYGMLINFVDNYNIFQIWKCQSSGSMYYRSGNQDGWGETWKQIITSAGYTLDSGAMVNWKNANGTTRASKVEGNAFFIENWGNDDVVTSRLVLRDKTHGSYAGHVELDANDGTNKCTLRLNPTGAISYGGNNLVRSVNGTKAGTDGNVTISLPTPNAYVTETWVSGNNWYRKYSDGWIEQGGYKSVTSAQTTSTTITLNKAFTNTNYTVVSTVTPNSTSNLTIGVGISTKTTTSVKIASQGGWSSHNTTGYYWYAFGK